jgi:hypothetical protein
MNGINYFLHYAIFSSPLNFYFIFSKYLAKFIFQVTSSLIFSRNYNKTDNSIIVFILIFTLLAILHKKARKRLDEYYVEFVEITTQQLCYVGAQLSPGNR